MEEGPDSLLEHLEMISGKRPEFSRFEESALPLFLRERYSLRRGHLFDREYLLATESSDWDRGSGQEYRDHCRLIRKTTGIETVLVLSGLSQYARNQLVQGQVPFIVPGKQIYLPLVMVDLRERFQAIRESGGKKLSPTAQLILLSYLLRKRVEELPLQKVAEFMGCSSMMVSKAKDELQANQLCESGRSGRSVVLRFNQSRRTLWKKAKAHLASPVSKSHWVYWPQPCYPALPAGLTALSQLGMLEPDPKPTYAMYSRVFRQNLENGIIHGCRGPEEANLQLEAWRYNPLILANTPGDCCREEFPASEFSTNEEGVQVDPLSLYLSLVDSPDERIQQQLENLIERMPW